MLATLQARQQTFPENRDYYLRACQIVGRNGLLPIGRSTFYAKVKTGELPQPIKLGPRISVWRKSDIIAFIEKGRKSDE